MLPTWIEDPRSRAVFINSMKQSVKGVMLVPPQANNPVITPVAAAANAPGLSPVVIVEGGEDSISETFSLIGVHDAATVLAVQNRLQVQITDSAYRRRLMNRPVLANHVFGSAGLPFRLDVSTFLEGQQYFELQFINPSLAGESQFRLAFESRKFQAAALARDSVTQEIKRLRKQKMYLNPYWLTSQNPITLAAGGFANVFFQNTRDYYLILFKTMCSALTTGIAGDTQEIISWELFDAKTDRPLQNQPVTLNTGSGTSSFPYVLPTPLLVEPNTNIRARFQNLVTDAETEVFFTFHGVGIYVSQQNPWREMMVDQPAIGPAVVGAP